MHTSLVIAAGLLLLAGLCALARARGGRAAVGRAALWFGPLWLVAALGNLLVGVCHAGYPLRDELPVFLAVFAVPGLAALAVRALARRATPH